MYPGERFNSITHLIGSVLALAGASVVITLAAQRGGATRITAVAIYGAMLFILYLSSTLYHSFRGRAKRIFHVFDHCSIYLLIAGTYTPFTLITLRGKWGWWMFGVIWALAIAGVVKDAMFHGRYRAASVVLYILMGWLVVIAYTPLKLALPSAALSLLIAGGIAYTLGVAFFAMSKKVAYTHGVWHLFAMVGSVCHFIAVARYVVA
jgi:hemolysin III